MHRIFLAFLIIAATAFCVSAADPTATSFSFEKCRGTASLYPDIQQPASYPDSLTPVFINHLGRHGARFPASAKGIDRLAEALARAESESSITATGRKLNALIRSMKARVKGQWGALDSIGEAEQRGIASRMYRAYPDLFKGCRIEAISTFAPRCIMSMYSFTHQLSRLNNNIEISTSSGRQYSYLLRPFDTDAEYREYRQEESWQKVLDDFRTEAVTLEPLRRAMGSLEGLDASEARDLAMDMFKLVAESAAAGVPCRMEDYFSREEINSLWQADNMQKYLLYSSNTISTIPADMASPLIYNLISTTDAAIEGADPTMPTVMLRFAHAETVIPLVSLLRLKGCYYMTNYFDTVATHWQDFDIAPMAANLQMVIFKTKKGRHYVRFDLNERPIPLMPGSDRIYIPWEEAKAYMNRCIPIFYQP